MPTFTPISKVTVGAGGTTGISFSGIPSTYTDLYVVLSTRDNNLAGGDWQGTQLLINGDSGNQPDVWFLGDSSHPTSPSVFIGTNTGQWLWTNTGFTHTSAFALTTLYFPEYANTAKQKTIIIEGITTEVNGAGVQAYKGKLWQSTSSITSLEFKSYSVSTRLVEFSTATLYGISKT